MFYNSNIFLFLIKYSSKYKISIFIMLLVSIFWSIDLSLRKYLMKKILDTIFESNNQNILSSTMPFILQYTGLAVLITNLFRFYGYFVDVKMVPDLKQTVAKDYFAFLLSKDYLFYSKHFAGELTNKVVNLAEGTVELIKLITDCFFRYILALVIAIYTLMLVNIKFALITLIWIIIFISVSCLYFQKLANLSRSYTKYQNQVSAHLTDNFINIKSIFLFSNIKNQISKFLDIYKLQVVTEQKLQMSYFWIWFIYGYSFDLLQGISIYFLICAYKDGNIMLGDVALVIGINLSIVDFLNNLTTKLTEYSDSYGKVIESLSLLHNEPKINKSKKIINFVRPTIIFNQVSFSYPDKNVLFNKISVKINAYEKIAIVGHSGAGKTTFINLILGLISPQTGGVFIGNENLKNFDLDFLRKNISIISQENTLFHGSIIDNITYGLDYVNNKEIEESIKLAGLEKFIANLPDKGKTIVGDFGIKLSGGERQRIIIARAFLKKAPILIFDELTNHLDFISIKKIQINMLKLMQNKTSIIITHNLSTLNKMDRILVFSNGRIVQEGRHSELIKSEGFYKEMFAST